ncbi:MAG: class C sortase [Actinomycetaceae bacterium]|nr:class C sortase [Actinomycetaceae bacterium]
MYLRKQKRPKPKHKAPRWQARPLVIVSLLIAYLGIVLITYPSAAQWVSQYHQSIIVRDMNQEIINVAPQNQAKISEAQHYNEELRSGATIESNANIAKGEAGAAPSIKNYYDLLSVNGSGYMGRIIIPSIEVDLPIYHGTSDTVLETGIGHLEGTSLPVGGTSTRSVLTGHRGLANAEMFSNLDKVAVADTFSVAILGEVFTYRVRDIKVIAPEETESIRPEADKDLMTLITCTPLGVNSHRILVTGERVIPSPQEDKTLALAEPNLPHFPWWIVWLVSAFIFMLVYIWISGRPVKSAQKRTNRGSTKDTENRVEDSANRQNIRHASR